MPNRSTYVNPGYLRWDREPQVDKSLEARIGALIKPGEKGTNECWQWLGKVTHEGYPRLGRAMSIHRVVFSLLVDEIVPGNHIHHVCRNRSCVNPRHLRQVTPDQHREAHAGEAGRKRKVVA